MTDSTKGPWNYFVGNANGRGLIRIEVDGTGEHIASMPRGKKSEDRARLIAAAPDLLSALMECEAYFDNRADADCDQDGYIPNEEMKLLGEVREAIAKATA